MKSRRLCPAFRGYPLLFVGRCAPCKASMIKRKSCFVRSCSCLSLHSFMRRSRRLHSSLLSTQLHAVRETRRRPVLELHAERQALGAEHVLDLGKRLLAEV